MADSREEFLRNYATELDYLRRAGAEFAGRYPKVAQRLGMSDAGSSDPHTLRLIESFAFLTAKLQRRIDAELPELSASLLGLLYPHFTSPIPTMAIGSFELDPALGLAEPVRVPAGAQMFARAESGEDAYFRVSYPMTLWPIDTSDIRLDRNPEMLDLPSEVVGTSAVIRIGLEAHDASFADLNVDSLRFYIHGDSLAANQVLEAVFTRTLRVAVRDSRGRIRMLPDGCLREVGFADDEAVLPTAGHSLPGYRLLQEYFAFPEQFRFVEVTNLGGLCDDTMCELLFLMEAPGDIKIGPETFRLGCAPIINLFERMTDPLLLHQESAEYHLVGDSRRSRSTEIHSILEMLSAEPGEAAASRYEPYYAMRYSPDPSQVSSAFWHMRREPTTRKGVSGTECFVSFMDSKFNPTKPAETTVYARCLMTNRDVAERVSVGARLSFDDGYPVRNAMVLTQPTPQLDPPLGGPSLWRLISHLSLNQLSLTSDSEGVHSLRALLMLYQTTNDLRTDNEINGIQSMSTRQVVRRLGNDAWRGFCRGLEITLTFDERFYVGSSAFALAMVLNRFLSLHASVNSFTQLVIRSSKRKGVWYRWEPMSGQRAVL